MPHSRKSPKSKQLFLVPKILHRFIHNLSNNCADKSTKKQTNLKQTITSSVQEMKSFTIPTSGFVKNS